MPDVRHLVKLGLIAATSCSTRNFYDRVSAFYEPVFTDHLVHAETMVSTLREAFAGAPTAAILDVACGTGVLTRRLRAQGFQTMGLDFSYESLRRLKLAAGDIPALQADAAALPFGPASFVAVTCLGAWRHFPEPQRVVEEIRRVLRPGGIFLVGYFPPKLGGLFSMPRGWFGRAIVVLYRWMMRVLQYTDRVDREMEREILRLLDATFAYVRRIESERNSYILLAASARETG